MRYIKTEISIAASPEKVWEKLLDFKKHPEWNPFIKSIEGEKALGGKLNVIIQPPNTKAMNFRPTILAFTENKELRWLGKGFIKGLFDGEHSFVLEPDSNGGTKLKHSERFSGILVSFFGKTLDKTKIGFAQMNEALKKECEK